MEHKFISNFIKYRSKFSDLEKISRPGQFFAYYNHFYASKTA